MESLKHHSFEEFDVRAIKFEEIITCDSLLTGHSANSLRKSVDFYAVIETNYLMMIQMPDDFVLAFL